MKDYTYFASERNGWIIAERPDKDTLIAATEALFAFDGLTSDGDEFFYDVINMDGDGGEISREEHSFTLEKSKSDYEEHNLNHKGGFI